MKEQEVFNSPSRGKINFSEIIYGLVDFMEGEPKRKYCLIIGTDSKNNNGHFSKNPEKSRNKFGTGQVIDFVSAIVIHKIGKGGKYFWQKKTIENISGLRQKIYQEATLSLNLAQKLLSQLNQYLLSHNNPHFPKYDLEIHIDIGEAGPTKDLIKEVVGMIQGSGFNAKTKPEAFGASKVADKHT